MTNINVPSPYRGLTPYTEEDAAYFFGRNSEIANLVANLEVARLTIFYGPSGVGKSSILRAGVIHKLQQRAQENMASSGCPEIIPIYFNGWQGEPLQGLSQAIIEAVQPFLSQQVTTEITIDDLQLSHLLATLSSQNDSEFLLVLDQFEEYFLYHPDERGPWTFAYELVQAVNNAALRANFLISMREDTLGRLDHFKGQIPFLWDNRLNIEHLSRTAGREALTSPLEQYNVDHNTYYTIETNLVETVLDQVGRGKVALSKQGTSISEADRGRIEAPYLQLVLTRLWEQEQSVYSTELRQTTLDALGGAESIVSNYLNDTMAGLPNVDQALAARFFDRLVTLSGSKIALTLVELAYYTVVDVATVQPLVQQLEQRRLLRSVQSPTGVTQYEIFHDVLGQGLLEWQQRYQETQIKAEQLVEERAVRIEAERRTQERAEEEQKRVEEQMAVAAILRQRAWYLGVALAVAILAVVIMLYFLGLSQARLNDLAVDQLLRDAQALKEHKDASGAITKFKAAAALDPALAPKIPDEINETLRYVANKLTEDGETLLRNAQKSDELEIRQQAMISATMEFSKALALHPPSDTQVYVQITTAEFQVGKDEHQPTSKIKDSWIMRTEVTNAQYKRCVDAYECTKPGNQRWNKDEFAKQPVTDVNWFQAKKYAGWVGGRLPNETEWEKMCQGNKGWIYPWGNDEPTSDRLNYGNSGLHDLTDVGSYPASVNGLYDMVGNAWEWTNDKFGISPFGANNSRENTKEDTERVLRGGSFLSGERSIRCDTTNSDHQNHHRRDIGFRVISPGF